MNTKDQIKNHLEYLGYEVKCSETKEEMEKIGSEKEGYSVSMFSSVQRVKPPSKL